MQKLTITAPTYSIEVAGNNEREVIEQAAFWLSLPTKCRFKTGPDKFCGAPLVVDFMTPQGFKYYKLKCSAASPHCVNLGQKKETFELYFDSSKQWETFRPGQSNDAGPGSATPDSASQDPRASEQTGNIGQKRNALIKLVKQCQDAGIRSGLIQGDVVAADDAVLDAETARLTQMLAKGAAV